MGIAAKKWKDVKDKDRVKALYNSAFPKEERLPWFVLRLMSARQGMGITAFYEDAHFCGMTVGAETEEILFLLFFAVEDGLRGKGYGSEILELLKAQNPDRAIVLNVELLDETAENYAQRVSRMRFYSRNGFYDTGYDIDEVGGTFRVLSTRQELDVDAYLQVFKRISFGFWKPYIRKAADEE